MDLQGCNRYIISQCNSALNVLEVYGLFMLGGWKKEELHIDIVPLFETIDDLQEAPAIMQQLYENETYQQHLARRQDRQTIMLGFSDGTKDGGYLMANWSIYQGKEGTHHHFAEIRYRCGVLRWTGRPASEGRRQNA